MFRLLVCVIIYSEWRFFRSENRIETDNLTTHTGEVWQRDGRMLMMRKLFHDDEKAVEYQADDFRALNQNPSWQRQALLIDAITLSQLKEVGARWENGKPLRFCRGDVDGGQLEVVWRVEINLPQSIVRTHGKSVELTQLQTVTALASALWKHSGGDYDVIDYADLGDHEHDHSF